MGRPRIHDGLDTFVEWMLFERRLSPSTAKLYVATTRRIFRSLGETVDQEALDTFLRASGLENPMGFSNVRQAWNTFAAWMETRETPVPLAKPWQQLHALVKPGVVFQKPQAPTTPVPLPIDVLPDAVRAAIRGILAEGVKVKDIPEITWEAVAFHELKWNRVHVKVPHERNTNWFLSSSAILVLWEYAQAGGDLSKPLVPRAPGSHQPADPAMLRREIQRVPAEELAAKAAEIEGIIRGDGAPRQDAPKPVIARSEPEGFKTTEELLAAIARQKYNAHGRVITDDGEDCVGAALNPSVPYIDPNDPDNLPLDRALAFDPNAD